jgi:hypothetical protein
MRHLAAFSRFKSETAKRGIKFWLGEFRQLQHDATAQSPESLTASSEDGD